ncbi:MAG: ABC transporter permease [Rubrobacteraceae bacterium]|uniref:ABC transporter permease n=1 Tax=Rubrobacter naiadicus TaxID=1392641 RepID=UPI00235F1E18|nr:ABC transporter permease [Rubrobacter naiadicus]MBX6762065.1 ABC transporter permease [Rubrobacteraceae bacterium]MCL6437910.1 ABC transporter permease [Rubrobacteraceae bacterium]
MKLTMVVAGRVVRQLLRNRRFVALSIAAPLVIVYLLKLFFDTLPPGFDVARYAVPVAAFIVHFLAFLLCAIALVQERTAGTMERMLVNGFRRAEIIGGYVVGYLGLATLQALAALTEVIWLFGLDYGTGTLLTLFVVIWLLALASVMLGIFVSTFARRESQVLPFIPLIILPSVFLSGLLVDVGKLPTWADWLGHLFPLFWANDVIQKVISPSGSLEHAWGSLAVLVGYGAVLLLFASFTLRDPE